MSFIFQWFFMILGLTFTFMAARWPGFEHHIATLALVAFVMAFRSEAAK